MRKKITLLLLALLSLAGTARADVEWTIWEGNQSFDFTTGGYIDIANYCKTIQEGDVLNFYVSIGTNDYHQKYLAVSSPTSGETTTFANWENFNADFSLEVNNTIFTEIVTNSGSFNVGGKDYTLTKVTVTRQMNSYIKTSLITLTENASFNGSKLSNAVAGDYICVDVTLEKGKTSGTYTLMGNDVSSATFTVYDKLMFALTDAQISAWTASAIWPWSSITNFASANVYLVHPVPSFSIGEIGYATFSASQQVTAPAGVKAYRATVVDGSTVRLTQFADNVIPANKGAIIAGDEGAVLEFTASSAETSETSDLIACTTATDVTTLAESGYDLYVLYPGTGASETELSLSTLLGSFGGWHNESTAISWNSSTYTLTYNEAYGSSEGGWCGVDWSSYDALKLTFSSNTLNNSATFYVAYNGQEESTTTSASFDVGATTVTVPLNASYKSAIGNVSLYSNATSGSLTFESAALIDNDGATVAEFRKTTSGTLAANKAYLKILSGGGARTLNISFGENEGTTGISEMPVAQKKVEDNIYYNLQGQRVSNPGKGLFIVNGKKVFIK